MTISIKCKGCQSTLRVPDTFAGKKVKCPKCQTALAVPDDDEVVAEVAADDDDDRDDRVADKPVPRRKPAPKLRDDDDDDDRRQAVRAGRGRDRDEEDDRPRDKRKRRRDDRGPSVGTYQPCPRCGEEGPKRVIWTWWGSFYGPAMFNHVRCLGCGHTYNGKSGGSNAIPAALFFTVPLLGILGILGGLFWFLWKNKVFG